MFEAFYKTAMSVRAASRPPGSEAGASTDRARLQRQNTPARPRSSLTATAPSLASTPPRSARACTSPSSSPARSSVKRYAHPPALLSDLPPVDAPRSSPAGQPGESDPPDESPLRRSAPFRSPPSSRNAGREQRFRRHVGVAQQGEAVQGHDHPRARGVRRRSCREAGTVRPPPAPSAPRRAFVNEPDDGFRELLLYLTSPLIERHDAVYPHLRSRIASHSQTRVFQTQESLFCFKVKVQRAKTSRRRRSGRFRFRPSSRHSRFSAARSRRRRRWRA